eukprot:scaffold2729_cov403-Prasinococcus_capsulatus_cf.AAC.8
MAPREAGPWHPRRAARRRSDRAGPRPAGAQIAGCTTAIPRTPPPPHLPPSTPGGTAAAVRVGSGQDEQARKASRRVARQDRLLAGKAAHEIMRASGAEKVEAASVRTMVLRWTTRAASGLADGQLSPTVGAPPCAPTKGKPAAKPHVPAGRTPMEPARDSLGPDTISV